MCLNRWSLPYKGNLEQTLNFDVACSITSNHAGASSSLRDQYFQAEPSNLQVQGHEGTTITLYAGVASKPSADYTWTLNGKVVGLDDDR